MNYRIFVPVRLGSSRLENKPLIEINGKTVIQRCLEQCPTRPILVCPEADAPALINGIDKTIGFDLVCNRPQDEKYIHCGTDRIAMAVERYPNLMEGVDIAINLQGDNVMVPQGAFNRLVELMESVVDPFDRMKELMYIANADDMGLGLNDKIGTLYVDCFSPSHVCAIRGKGPRMIYFCREWPKNVNIGYRHVGIYAYNRWTLRTFLKMEPVLIEAEEKLEQLRWVANGLPIYGAEAGMSLGSTQPDYEWVDINTMMDVEYARKVLK